MVRRCTCQSNCGCWGQLWISEPTVGYVAGFLISVLFVHQDWSCEEKAFQAFKLHFCFQPPHTPSASLTHPPRCAVLFMINTDNSVLWCHLLWLLHLRATRSSYWLSARPTLHFVSVSGSPRDRRARQSYKVKCLGLAPALQVSVIILLEAFLLCWIIMEVGVVALSPLKCGWRKQTRGAEKCLLCCNAIWGAWHQSKPASCQAGFTADFPTSFIYFVYVCVCVCALGWGGVGGW